MAFFVLMLLPIMLGGPWRRSLRVLVPSWRFFEDIEPGHELWIYQDQSWQPPPPVANHLFLNPEGLLELACRDLVHTFLTDLEYRDTADLGDWPSYQLLRNLTRERGGSQFKLTFHGQDFFLSGTC